MLFVCEVEEIHSSIHSINTQVPTIHPEVINILARDDQILIKLNKLKVRNRFIINTYYGMIKKGVAATYKKIKETERERD